jgi:nitrite reductase/ring-hydroxylating ferredoxin subunit/uncharacterized membrane protein
VLSRLMTRLIAAQAGWARPFGDFNARWLKALFKPIVPVRDFLNGSWLGHPLHGVLTDVPIGSFTLVIIFDIVDQRVASDVCLGLGVLSMIGAALAGFADYAETDDETPRMVATVHATLMVVTLILYLVSLVVRLGSGPTGSRALPIAVDVIAYLLLSVAAYVGGDVVYALGNMVNRHAWRFTARAKWQPLDVTDIPENTLVRGKAGTQTLVLVRRGDNVLALHDECAHAGGPLSQGTIVDSCVQCPWHGSRFDLATGDRRRGPTNYDQPRYEVRAAAAGGWEARRTSVGSGAPPEPVEAA